jgi:hypothetical protein
MAIKALSSKICFLHSCLRGRSLRDHHAAGFLDTKAIHFAMARRRAMASSGAIASHQMLYGPAATNTSRAHYFSRDMKISVDM